MFGFFLTNRVGLAIARWWKGTFAVNQMFSKWMDAFIQIAAFVDREVGYLESEASKSDLPRQKQEICRKIEQLHDFKDSVAHWFSLMVAMAIASLSAGSAKHLSFPEGTQCMDSKQAMLKRRLSRSSQDFENGISLFELQLRDPNGETHRAEFEVIGELTSEECAVLQQTEAKVIAVMKWIIEALTLAHNEELLTVSAPILSRCYQELSNGILGFNEGLQVAMLQYPFPLQQMMMLMMNSFVLMMPVVVEKFTQAMILTPLLTFFIVLGYWGLNAAAIRLESPFSDAVNDVTLGALLEQANKQIRELKKHSWQVSNLFCFSSALHQDLWGSEDGSSLAPSTSSKLGPQRESVHMSSTASDMGSRNGSRKGSEQLQQEREYEHKQNHQQERPNTVIDIISDTIKQHTMKLTCGVPSQSCDMVHHGRDEASDNNNSKSNQQQPATASTSPADNKSAGGGNGPAVMSIDSVETPAQNPQRHATGKEQFDDAFLVSAGRSTFPVTRSHRRALPNIHVQNSQCGGSDDLEAGESLQEPTSSRQVLVQPISPHVPTGTALFEDPPLFPTRRRSADAALGRSLTCQELQRNTYGPSYGYISAERQMVARNALIHASGSRRPAVPQQRFGTWSGATGHVVQNDSSFEVYRY
eukprot:gnl/MRDRNA2_/MRDRNA2_83949_c0_seq1.p1 gnl/MRDRNA2_/MRDRNA2_83949_c0~~gnl/MRDRNA2_/MRDRNA2_83949_c0_seq1.p1  ORF type:complete len:681 (-),score=119.56 gnl/MRDRNA2_/MRDRNA2_83949_c0_seq1:208-2136(-)